MEPVGLDTTRPSATNVARCDASMVTSIRTTRASDPRAMTMSLSAVKVRSEVRPPGRMAPASPIRSLTVNAPSTSWARTGSSWCASALDRKPTLPRLIPRIGTSTTATACAARRKVPSPPSTTSTSVVGSCATSSAVSPAWAAQWSILCAAHQAAARSRRPAAASLVGLYAKPMRRTVTMPPSMPIRPPR